MTYTITEQDVDRIIDESAHTPALAARLRAAASGKPAASVPQVAHDTVMALDSDALDEALTGVHRFDPQATSRDTAGAAYDAMVELARLSDAHKERFGLLLVLASAGRPVEQLIAEGEQRLVLPDRAAALDAARASIAAILQGRIGRALEATTA